MRLLAINTTVITHIKEFDYYHFCDGTTTTTNTTSNINLLR
jgi:hypothetical protein